MKNFSFLTPEISDNLFFKVPETFDRNSHRDLLSVSLGATLYSPATRKTLANDVIKMAKKGSTSVILCLEDSVPDSQLEEAESNLTTTLETLSKVAPEELPLLFIRPRNPEHLQRIESKIRPYMHVLTGFSLPKFDRSNADRFLELTSMYSMQSGVHMYAMPILESPNLIYSETRERELKLIYRACEKYRDHILNIRIGATDMASPFGLRRSRDLNIYDVKVIAAAIADIVNTFGRAEDGYTISGPVWEHFTDRERLFKPRLRQTPFAVNEAENLRYELILKDLDGLIREVELDRANGLWGKTVIHPTHVALVNSMLVVSREEYSDALSILDGGTDGAIASTYRNKMNEIKPHTAWAKKIMLRADAFGVCNENINFVDFMEASIT